MWLSFYISIFINNIIDCFLVELECLVFVKLVWFMLHGYWLREFLSPGEHLCALFWLNFVYYVTVTQSYL